MSTTTLSPPPESTAITPSTRRFQRKREELIDAAIDLLNREGVRGMTLAAVAARVGLLPTGISYYFKRKEDLAAACFTRTLEELRGMAEQAAQEPTRRDRATRFWDLFVSARRQIMMGARPDMAMLEHSRVMGSPHADLIFKGVVDLFRSMQALFLDADPAPTGRRRRGGVRGFILLSQALWAIAWLYRYDPEDTERAGRWADDILAGGLAAPGRSIEVGRPLDLAALKPVAGEPARDAFFEAATAVINEHGYHGASVDKIAARANATKGAFYHHHEAKDDVVVECFRRTLSVFRRSQNAATASCPDGWSRLCSATEALIRYDRSEHGPLLKMSSISGLPQCMRTGLVGEWLRVADRFAAIISDGIVDGSIRPVDPSIAAEMLLGIIHSAPDLHALVPELAPAEAYSRYARLFLLGLFREVAAE
ncbi:TetR/AcrR family transcriptional regulator [Zavarzinia sp. CC-PAN008]|uniref:TetR/AcrR family transcriptional regulator n=1 Tax=Zavarzinia sp. CC-PAN008 TaxID=3243332 RepID=UPI003F74A98C